jgi:hypothetical protein
MNINPGGVAGQDCRKQGDGFLAAQRALPCGECCTEPSMVAPCCKHRISVACRSSTLNASTGE